MRNSIFALNAALEESHWWFVGRRTIIEGLVHEVFPPANGRRVVDVGCGTGANVAALSRDYDAVGFDLSEEAITFARERFPDVNFRLEDAVVHLDELSSTGTPGDRILILLNDVLEHVKDDAGFLARIVGAAPSGSWLLITVPANPGLWSRHDESHGHYRRYTVDSLRNLLDRPGLEPVFVSHFNAKLYPLVKAIRKTTALLGTSAGPSDSDLSVPPAPVNRWLTSVFSSELGDLLRALRAGMPARPAFRRGVSLLALVRIVDRHPQSRAVE